MMRLLLLYSPHLCHHVRHYLRQDIQDVLSGLPQANVGAHRAAVVSERRHVAIPSRLLVRLRYQFAQIVALSWERII